MAGSALFPRMPDAALLGPLLRRIEFIA